ncbi:extracellular solute-binding protein [Paenibacillus methanolicus]|uniref:Iron(III) transport system substrate-binding protein n=1 Tax=Paenibacillus methanolicus TaxID=582686 RepID=A0A5S5CHY6_9BACL|nr:extracellular solute-binding protein [Paenibacillus methanolicus]TYP78112.1 iron(III) transport system substrate-binding protein [Paenibacillus methanolicus]
MLNHYRNKSMTLATAILLTMALSACGSTNNAASNDAAGNNTAGGNAAAEAAESTTGAGGNAGAAEAGATNAASNATKSDEPLVVYLNDFDEIIKPMFEEATGYKLELVTGNGAELASRIEAEKGNPHWDVLWMDSMPMIDQLGKNGQLLENWTPSNQDGLTDFAKGLIPASGAYYPTGAHAASVIVYNTKAYDAASAPKTWQELADAKFKDAVGMADPAVAAPAYPFVAWFFQSQGTEAAQGYFDSLMKNGLRVYPKNPNVAKALTGGEIKAAALQESNAYTLKAKGEPVDVIWPAEGAPASVRVAAIQKETKHADAAQAFVEFLLDPKTQQALIDQGEESYFEPSAQGVKAKADRAAEAKLVVAEAAWAGEHEGEIKQWFADQAVK